MPRTPDRATAASRGLSRPLAALMATICASAPAPAQDDRLAAPVQDAWYRSGTAAVAESRAHVPDPGRARNVILFVGDGMGISTVTAARILEGQLRGESGEENRLSFERLPWLALAKTYNTNQQVPDSAGTMTAMMTGVKTKAGVLGVDDRVRLGEAESASEARVPSLLELAEARGLATGVVSTARITHATPAACYAHSAHRNWEDDGDLPPAARAAGFADIARQLVEFDLGDGIEVALGGGRRHFLPVGSADPEYPELAGSRRDGRNLMTEWQRLGAGSEVVWNRAGFDALASAVEGGGADAPRRVLGLFEPSHMQYETDRAQDGAGEPSLSEMTQLAIEILRRDEDGFFLMVEAGRIDHGHHAGNAHRALTEAVELSRAVERALAMVDLEETLIVVTADHSHTFTLAGYPTRGSPILGMVMPNDASGKAAGKPALDLLGLPYTTLAYANGPGYAGASSAQPEGPKHFPHQPGSQKAASGRPDLREVDTCDPQHLQEAAVPLGSETHGGEDVAIYAGGPGASLFHGVQEQHFVFHAMLAALGWDSE